MNSRSERAVRGIADRIRASVMLQRLTGTNHALLASSGDQALRIALKAAGVEPGDEVILAAFDTNTAAQAVESVGAVPIYGDVLGAGTLNPSSVEEMLNPRTAAVVATHVFGIPAGIRGLRRVIGERRVGVIEYAPHALGASLRGKPIGSMGDLACFSFGSGDMVDAGGGGAVVTSKPDLARRISQIAAELGSTSGNEQALVERSTLGSLTSQLTGLRNRLMSGRRSARALVPQIAEALESVAWVILVPEPSEPTWYRIPVVLAEHDRTDEAVWLLKEVGIRAEVGPEPDQSHCQENPSLSHTRFLSHHLVLVDPNHRPGGTDTCSSSSFH